MLRHRRCENGLVNRDRGKRRAMLRTVASWSTVSSVEAASMPDNSHDAPMPVPVPSSNNAPAGLEAARTRSNEPVSWSEAMRNPAASVAR